MRKWVGGIVARFERRRICAGSRSQNFLPRLARMRACVNVSPLWPAFSSTRTEITRAKNKFTPLVTPRRLGIMFGHCGRPARYHSWQYVTCRFVDKFQKYYYIYIWGSNLSNFIYSIVDNLEKKRIIFFYLIERLRARIDCLNRSVSEIFKIKILGRE